MQSGYELVIGLEVHVELKTRTKIFCGCPTTFGAAPNTQCCPVCMGYPGTLPVLNAEAVHLAVLAGLATNCTIARYSKQDRKNYFYPDLPKAYQISQFDLPLCTDGCLMIETEEGSKRIGITRIHIEEDAGKLIHDAGQGTFIDCNRCGVPLIEIVSEPDMRSPQEAAAYLRKLKAVIAYTGVSDCRMQEGSLRCDVNLSIRRPGEPLGTRTEMKNLNSFVSVQKAIEQEYRRQVEAALRGETIVQETRRFDQASGKTYAMRRKENAHDYRYFPEPDLAPIVLTQEQIDAWRHELPMLPDARKAAYMEQHGLSSYAAEQMIASRYLAEYFEEAAASCHAVRTLANLMITEVFRLLEGEDARIPIPPAHLAAIADMAEQGVINNGTAKKTIAATWSTVEKPEDYIDRMGLRQLRDEGQLREIVRRALAEHPDMVDGYYKGKLTLKRALMGAAMRLTGGMADPVILQRLMDEALDT
ncbi:MAG: Asp-tRNA(Asn)/Glu-tRNA(Gln) amidotransferase subunit GatB [Clostridia bacterium]|nr:Asp-tRNA(Asn)/Glu-tRNA(Gln) amidotransferase subunit GatB [Clostridia bacterium]